MFATAQQLEILDLRHFGAEALRPLLAEQAAVWERRLLWNYRRSIELLLEYVESRSLTGYVALRSGRVAGYTFGVCEASKAVLGDVYAFGEGAQRENPVCNLLLDHLLETLQATPGIERIESQLLLFPDGALESAFRGHGMQPAPRHFMVRDLHAHPGEPFTRVPSGSILERWQPEAYSAAAILIHDAYLGHMDSEINDQYRSLAGARRFLHNIVHFPGCGIFDGAHSWALREPGTGTMQALVLCSRVRADAAHITQLCVAPSLRGRGLGKFLLGHCLAELTRSGTGIVSLTVTESNAGARQLYQQQGFATLHRFEAWVWNARGRR